jgi:predicted Zn-dependent protease
MISAIAFLLLASSLLPSGQATSPLEPPKTAARTGPKTSGVSSFEKLSEAADQARNANRVDDAIQLYKQALAVRPQWPEGLWYLGTLYYQSENYPAARDALRRFVTHDSDKGPGWALLGMSEFQTREYPRSLDHLQHAMALGMGGRKDMAQSVFYFVAVLLTRFEQYSDSMGMMLAMIKSGQQPDLLVEPIGLAALRMPLLPSEIPPDRRDMIRMAGQGALALEAEHQEEAEKLFRNMVAAYPNEPGVHFLLGAFLLDLRPDDGIREMRRELEISPFHVPARLRLAEEYLKEEHFDDALSLAQEAARLEPKDGPAHMMLGEVLVAKGDLSEGIRELETSEKEAPQTVRTHWDLLRAYTTAGRRDDAQREKEKIEKLNGPTAGQ